MANAPVSLVTRPTPVGLPFGLFSAITFRPNADRWESGIMWEPATCDPVQGIGDVACDPEPTVGLPKQLDPNQADMGTATPFTVYGHFTCSPVGYDPTAANSAADAHLAAREQGRVEQALWTGDLGNVPNLSGANGYPAPDMLPGPVSLAAGIATLENEIGTRYGSLGVIHMTRAAATHALAADLLTATAGRLTTHLGTPVVAGAGYPGTVGSAPADGNTVIVGSPSLFAYRSDVFNSSGRPGDLLDRDQNVLRAIAERSYVVGFDPCGVIAIEVLTNSEDAQP